MYEYYDLICVLLNFLDTHISEYHSQRDIFLTLKPQLNLRLTVATSVYLATGVLACNSYCLYSCNKKTNKIKWFFKTTNSVGILLDLKFAFCVYLNYFLSLTVRKNLLFFYKKNILKYKLTVATVAATMSSSMVEFKGEKGWI